MRFILLTFLGSKQISRRATFWPDGTLGLGRTSDRHLNLRANTASRSELVPSS